MGGMAQPYEEPELVLPVLPRSCDRSDLNCVDAATVARLLRGEMEGGAPRHLVVDCRFDYEFMGGHIRDAVNACGPDAVTDLLFRNAQECPEQLVVVFHCEFSKKRGPEVYVSEEGGRAKRVKKGAARRTSVASVDGRCFVVGVGGSGGRRGVQERCGEGIGGVVGWSSGRVGGSLTWAGPVRPLCYVVVLPRLCPCVTLEVTGSCWRKPVR